MHGRALLRRQPRSILGRGDGQCVESPALCEDPVELAIRKQMVIRERKLPNQRSPRVLQRREELCRPGDAGKRQHAATGDGSRLWSRDKPRTHKF